MQTDDRQVGRRVRNELLCLAQIELAVAAYLVVEKLAV